MQVMMITILTDIAVAFTFFYPPCRSVYDDLVAKGVIVPAKEVPPPTVPMDYSWARVSKPTSHWHKC